VISADLLALNAPGALLAGLAQAAVPDTIVTIQAKSSGWQLWFDTITGIASVVIALALIALALAVIPAALNSRKMYGRLNEIIKRFRSDLDPIVHHASATARNLEYVSTAVREDVERLNQMVASTHLRLERAAAAAEQRVGEFNALLGVVQEEAEGLFIGSASAVRGVRAGTEAFRRLQAEDDGWDEEEDDYAAGDGDVHEDFGDGDFGDEDGDADARDFAGDDDYADERTDDQVSDEELEIRIARREAKDIDPDRVF
jgi:hypothetical protein